LKFLDNFIFPGKLLKNRDGFLMPSQINDFDIIHVLKNIFNSLSNISRKFNLKGYPVHTNVYFCILIENK
jgi:hypothetical protein